MRTSLTLLIVLLLTLTGCGIPQEVHDEVLDDLEQTRIELAETRRAAAENEDTLTGQIQDLESRIAALESDKTALEDELRAAREDLDLYGDRAGSLEEALAANREELDELRRARRLTEDRLQAYRSIANQLASMIEAGQLSVTIRDGRMVINLADDILFDSGRTDIKADGQRALQELAEVLIDIPDRNFLIAGHTDNVPMRSGRFASNWELSTARAVQVVRFLEDSGVAPTNLAAAGFGEHDPIASNEEADTRALNRRIEIILMPNIEELPTMPDTLFEES